MNTPIGLFGLSSLARLVSMRLAIICRPCDWPTTRRLRMSARLENGLDLVLDHAADRNAGPVGHDRGDRLLVDMGVDHALLGIARFQRVELLAELSARTSLARGAVAIGVGRGGIARLRLGQDLAQAADLGDQRLLGLPLGLAAPRASRCSATISASISAMRSPVAVPRSLSLASAAFSASRAAMATRASSIAPASPSG